MKQLLIILLFTPSVLLSQGNLGYMSHGNSHAGSRQERQDPVISPALERFLAKSTEYKTLLSEVASATKALEKQTKACAQASSQQSASFEMACGLSLRQAQSLLDSLQLVEVSFIIDANRLLELFEADPKTSERVASAAEAFAAGKVQAADKLLDAKQIAIEADPLLQLPIFDARRRILPSAATELFFKAYLQALDFENPQRFENVAKYANQSMHYAENKDNLIDIGALFVNDDRLDLGAPFLEKALEKDLSDAMAGLITLTLAEHYVAQNRTTDADAMYKRSVAYYGQLAKVDSEKYNPYLTKILVEYGQFLLAANRYEEVHEIYHLAQACVENLDAKHPEKVALSTNVYMQLGWLYEQAPQLGPPLDMYARAVEISNQSKTAEPKVKKYIQLQALKQYAEACHRLQEFQKAADNYAQAFAIMEWFAKENPSTYEPQLIDLAQDWLKTNDRLGNVQEVERLYLYIIHLAEKHRHLGDDYMEENWAVNQMNLGNFYRNQDRLLEGAQYYKRGWQAFPRLAALHPDTYDSRMAGAALNYAMLLRDLEQYPAADSLFQKSLGIAERIAKAEPLLHEPLLADVLAHYGLQLSNMGKAVEAKPYLVRSLEIYQRIDQRDPESLYAEIVWNLIILGECEVNEGQIAEGKKWFQKALDHAEQMEAKHPGSYGTDVASQLANLADLSSELGDNEEACHLTTRALEITIALPSKKLESFRPDIATYQNNLGYYRMLSGQFEESFQELSASLAAYQGLLFPGKVEHYSEYLRSYRNLFNLKDSLEAHNDWHKVIAVQTLRAQSAEALGGYIPGRDSLRASANGALAWALLFEQRFAEAQAVSEKGFGLDPTQSWILTNWGHAFLFQGDWEKATKIYQDYIDAAVDKNAARDALVEDWDRLEFEKVASPQMVVEMAKARAWLKERLGEK